MTQACSYQIKIDHWIENPKYHLMKKHLEIKIDFFISWFRRVINCAKCK